MLKKIVSFIAVCMMAFAVHCDMMYWEVNDTATVDSIYIKSFLVPYVVDDCNWNAIRVKVVDGQSHQILDLWFEDEHGDVEIWDGIFGVELMDGGDGRWGTGHFFVQSSIDIDTCIARECYIIAELGHCTSDPDGENAEWQTLEIIYARNITSLQGVI